MRPRAPLLARILAVASTFFRAAREGRFSARLARDYVRHYLFFESRHSR